MNASGQFKWNTGSYPTIQKHKPLLHPEHSQTLGSDYETLAVRLGNAYCLHARTIRTGPCELRQSGVALGKSAFDKHEVLVHKLFAFTPIPRRIQL